eukprot:4708147-Amphidinium_carterae.1
MSKLLSGAKASAALEPNDLEGTWIGHQWPSMECAAILPGENSLGKVGDARAGLRDDGKPPQSGHETRVGIADSTNLSIPEGPRAIGEYARQLARTVASHGSSGPEPRSRFWAWLGTCSGHCSRLS